MIIGWVVSVVTACFSFLFNLMPTFSMPSWLSAGTAVPSGVANTIGGYLAVVAPFLPINLILTVLSSVLSLWLAIVGYLIFQWVWSHVPTIAGFGTGDGG